MMVRARTVELLDMVSKAFAGGLVEAALLGVGWLGSW